MSVAVVLSLSSLLFFNPLTLQKTLKRFQNIAYDVMLGFEYQPIKKSTPIVIIDIDDQSIAQEGRWPWNRKKMGQLISTLYSKGAKVIAIDIIFPESEQNLVDQVISEIKQIEGDQASSDFSNLEASKPAFDFDSMFAEALAKGNSVLGFAFTNGGTPVGELPKPLVELPPGATEGEIIPSRKSYLSNIPILQKAAKTAGFINAMPDFDGVIRYSPMLLRYKELIFPSLSLAAVNRFLDEPELKILIADYRGEEAIEGIILGNIRIPTDAWGRILIPFRGPPYSSTYISAADVLSGKVDNSSIENKLVFIGSSATAMGDLVATAMAPSFVGIEVHAHIASGILEGYLPYKPVWERGVRVILVFCVGLLLSFILPFLGPIVSFLFTAIVVVILVYVDHYLWKEFKIVFPIIFPLFSILLLYIINQVAGYLFESRRRRDLKSVFGQYVPPEYLDLMLKKSKEFGLEGEAKELTVLFADIRKFTTISEGFSPIELKEFLNAFLTPMTEVIFQRKGTIDKYVGDMIMAFWGAPLEDQNNAEHAIEAAFDMHKQLDDLNQQFAKKNIPEVHIGIGVNTGSMNVGDMGSKYRKAYTVLGDAVNLGSRLESLTKLYNIKTIVGEETFERTKSLFLFRQLDKVRVKGKEKSIYIYQPLCRTESASEEIQALVSEHQKGLDAYMQKRWDEAEQIFEKLKVKEALYELYLSRIEKFRKEAPPNEWDGTFVLEEK